MNSMFFRVTSSSMHRIDQALEVPGSTRTRTGTSEYSVTISSFRNKLNNISDVVLVDIEPFSGIYNNTFSVVYPHLP